MPAVQTTFICVALTTSWIIPSGSKAESNQLSLDKCFQMQFPDVLQIETCLGGSLDMCGESHRGVLDDVERLNQCLMSAIFSRKTAKVILTFLRKLIIFSFRNMFPRASSVIVPVLKAFLPKVCKKREGCDHPLLSEYSCVRNISVSFIDYFGVGECVKMHEYICTSAGINKCIFNKLPGVDVKNILRVFLCRIMSMLIGYLRMQNIGDAFEPIYDALHTLGNCKSSRPISQKAEKRILRDLQFRLARADLRLQ
ncbi:uncharacterized protein LOC144138191 isoform X2 [Haemaphysalis longicornis]